MSRKVRISDVAAAASWHFGTDISTRRKVRSPKREAMARGCAYVACRQLGFTWQEIASAFHRDRTTVMYGATNGHTPDPKDVVAVLRNARLRAHADQDVLA